MHLTPSCIQHFSERVYEKRHDQIKISAVFTLKATHAKSGSITYNKKDERIVDIELPYGAFLKNIFLEIRFYRYHGALRCEICEVSSFRKSNLNHEQPVIYFMDYQFATSYQDMYFINGKCMFRTSPNDVEVPKYKIQVDKKFQKRLDVLINERAHPDSAEELVMYEQRVNRVEIPAPSVQQQEQRITEVQEAPEAQQIEAPSKQKQPIQQSRAQAPSSSASKDPEEPESSIASVINPPVKEIVNSTSATFDESLPLFFKYIFWFFLFIGTAAGENSTSILQFSNVLLQIIILSIVWILNCLLDGIKKSETLLIKDKGDDKD